ncbi:MAG: tRNA (N(6)-L-threonylcarbamoyladenosine(37)-C(2))-methylthiotransferase MtaB [Deltaproteobacteria bacterium]|nr:tRNA (N(6)-L-threonylcarbamoyladenosine(37)-C(2))-methylthiotransferase MtaB [Deltaproteobacteria bacterium]
MKQSFKIITLGCKVNQCESAYMEEFLIGQGCRKVNKEEPADIVILNGCIVTGSASYQTRQAIRRAVRENPGGKIGAIGCYGQVYPDELSSINGLNLIGGNTNKGLLPGLLMNMNKEGRALIVREDFDRSNRFEHIPITKFSDRTRAFLKIQDGCESLCTYCIIPKARGPLRSLEPDDVITSLKIFKDNGYKEVVLTGINLGKYGRDLGGEVDLATLLSDIEKNDITMRIRLSSLNPTEINATMIELMAGRDWLCRHFHISLQSGDDLILKRMNRDYNAESFVETVNNIKSLVPYASIGVDVLVGFPGEDNSSFSKTYRLLSELPVSYFHVFPYSRRKGTPAAKFSHQVEDRVIKKRVFALRLLDQKKRQAFRENLLGSTFSVLSEGWVSGRSGIIGGLADNYVRFTFPSKNLVKNEIVSLRAEDLTRDGVSASLWNERSH